MIITENNIIAFINCVFFFLSCAPKPTLAKKFKKLINSSTNKIKPGSKYE